MKRLHLHMGVDNLAESIKFYTALFGVEPTKTKHDYAKWLSDDPYINFAISTRAQNKGIDHLGIQVDDESELAELRERFRKANLSAFDEGETTCCYAKSNKSWVEDPDGLAWEAYYTMEDAKIYGQQTVGSEKACCSPARKDVG